MFDKVTIAYRGAGYEIGQGRGFYGVWAAGTSKQEPLERWAETPDGWSAAWTRFASMEAPGTIVPVGRNTPPVGAAAPPAGGIPAGATPVGATPAAGTPVSAGHYTAPYGAAPYGAGTVAAAGNRAGAIIAAGLLIVGVALGVAGLFSGYLNGVSLASRDDQVIPHAVYLGVWTVGAVLILLGGVRPRLGALLSAGVSAVTFGLFFSDAGLAVGGNGASGGTGLILSLIGWFACTVGAAFAFLVRPAVGPADQASAAGQSGSLSRPRGAAVGPVVMMILAGLGLAAAFAPGWDHYTLRTAAGQTLQQTLGDAFAGSNPGLVTTGDVLVMIAVAALVIVAAFWRPVRHGALLLAGAIIPMAAQAISALVQIGQPASPAQFGLSNAQAQQLGLTISSSLAPAFWIYCVFGVVLLVSCAWMLFTPQQAVAPGPISPAGPVPQTPETPETPQAPQASDDEDADGIGDTDGAHQAEPAQGLK